MSIVDVIKRANAFVFETTGKIGDPVFIRLIDGPGGRRSWRIIYGARLFFPEIIGAGGTVDGGEFKINFDEETGIIEVVE